MQKKKRINLILSGGGYKGYAHLGVIKVLVNAGYTINRIGGCSVGAMIGAMYCATKNIDKVIEFLNNTSLYKLPDISFSKTGLLKGDKIIKHIESFIKIKTFEKLKIPLVINATNINTGEEVIFKKGSLLPAIRASIAYPAIFTPKELNKNYFVDGGLVNPVPITLLKPTIPTIVSDVLYTTSELRNFKATNIVKQSIEILQKTLITKQLQKIPHKYVHITPDTSKWDVFNIINDQKIILVGENATRKALPKIAKMFK